MSSKGRALVFLSVGALVACTSHGQTLEAHEVGTGSGTVSNWESEWGSYDRDYHQTKKIRITVRDVTRRLQNAEVCVYFVGRKQPQWDLFIYNYAILKVDLHGDMEQSDEIAAPSLFLNEQNYRLLNEHRFQGAKMEGWIAIGRAGSGVFGAASSNQNLLDAARDGSLDKLIAEAKIREKKSGPVSKPRENRAKVASNPPSLPSITPVPSPAVSAAPAAQFVTVTSPIEVTIQYGKTMLPRGTRLKVISRDGATLNAIYLNETVAIPIESTDLR